MDNEEYTVTSEDEKDCYGTYMMVQVVFEHLRDDCNFTLLTILLYALL